MTRTIANGSDPVLRVFEAKAATWSSKYAADGRLVGRLTLFADAANRHVGPGGPVLDLGCGTGELARYLAAGGRQVTGCDISEAMLVRASAADPAGAVEWVRLPPEWKVLPFADGTFATVVASSVLEYVKDPAAVLRECARAIRPGGTVVFSVPDGRHPIRWLEWCAVGLAHLPRVRVARRVPRLDCYLTYLDISRQRHRYRWWLTVAADANLLPIAKPRWVNTPSPMRVRTFRRPVKAEESH